MNQLNLLEVPPREARALYRVVCAMRDGHCPKCGFLGTASEFAKPGVLQSVDHVCPHCGFEVTQSEEEDALDASRSILAKSTKIFEDWTIRNNKAKQSTNEMKICENPSPHFIILLPTFLTKAMLNCSFHPIFYFRGSAIKFLRLPVAVFARIDSPLNYIEGGCRPRVYLKIAMGTKRSEVLDAAILRICPPPNNAEDGVFHRFFRPVIGFAGYPKKHASYTESKRAEDEKRQKPVRDVGSLGEPSEECTNRGDHTCPSTWYGVLDETDDSPSNNRANNGVTDGV